MASPTATPPLSSSQYAPPCCPIVTVPSLSASVYHPEKRGLQMGQQATLCSPFANFNMVSVCESVALGMAAAAAWFASVPPLTVPLTLYSITNRPIDILRNCTNHICALSLGNNSAGKISEINVIMHNYEWAITMLCTPSAFCPSQLGIGVSQEDSSNYFCEV